MTYTRHKIKRVLLHIILLLVLYILQTSVFTRLRLFGVYPMLLPLAVVGIGLFEEGLWGGIWGIAAGVLCDISMADSFLLFTVTLTVIGFFTGFFSEFIIARGFPSFFVLSVISLILIALLQMFKYLVFYKVDFMLLSKVALYQTLYSAIFIIPVYYPVRRVTRRTRA